MSGTRVPHLLCRNGIYHLRVKVPAYVQCRLGSREVHRSFGSCSLAKAKALTAIYANRVKAAFVVITKEDMAKAEARSLVRACFDDLVREAESWSVYPSVTSMRDLALAEQQELSTERVAALAQQIESGTFDGTVTSLAQSCIGKGFDGPLGLGPDLLEGIARALIQQQLLFQLRLTDRLLPFTPTDPLFAAQLEPAPLATTSSSFTPSESNIGPTVGDAATLYLAAGKKRWVHKTYVARVWQIGFLVESLGATRHLNAVTSHDVRTYRDQILSLRANHGRRTHLTFAERQTENVERRIAPKTAAIIFETCKAFFAWAKRDEGMIAINPAEDVRIVVAKKPKGKRTRRPFLAGELVQLFSSPVFTGSMSRHRRFTPGQKVYRDAKFWIPILGYYLGARMGEIVQLLVSDVVLSDLPHISINEEHDEPAGLAERKHVKTEAGVRLVPLHPDLIELGFREFVSEVANKGNSKRLFPEVKYGVDGQASSRFSNWFARLMDSVGLTDPSLVFHSLRHNAEDAFRDAEKPQYLIDRIIGHSDGSTSAGYGLGVSLETASRAVEDMKLLIRIPSILGP